MKCKNNLSKLFLVGFITFIAIGARFPTAIKVGCGVFTDSGQSLANSNDQSVVLDDLDGDSDLDAFIGNINDQLNLMWLNNCSLTADASVPYSVAEGGSVTMAGSGSDMERIHQQLMIEVEKNRGKRRAEQDFSMIDKITGVLHYSSAPFRPPSLEDIEEARLRQQRRKILIEQANQWQQAAQAQEGEIWAIPEISNLPDWLLGVTGNQITIRQFADGRLSVSFQDYVTQEDGTNWTQGVIWQDKEGLWHVYYVNRPPDQNMVFDPTQEVVMINGEEHLALIHCAVKQEGQSLRNSLVRAEYINRNTGQVTNTQVIYQGKPGEFTDYTRSVTNDLPEASVTFLLAGPGFQERRAVWDQAKEEFVLKTKPLNPDRTVNFANGLDQVSDNGNTLYSMLDYTNDAVIIVEVDENDNVIKVIQMIDLPDGEKLEKHKDQLSFKPRVTSLGVGDTNPLTGEIVAVVGVFNEANKQARLKLEIKDKEGEQLTQDTVYIEDIGELWFPAIQFTDSGDILLRAHQANGNSIFIVITWDRNNSDLATSIRFVREKFYRITEKSPAFAVVLCQ